MVDTPNLTPPDASIQAYDWTIADNASPPFCAVYKSLDDEIIESRPWSKAAEIWAERRAAQLNANAALSTAPPAKPEPHTDTEILLPGDHRAPLHQALMHLFDERPSLFSYQPFETASQQGTYFGLSDVGQRFLSDLISGAIRKGRHLPEGS